MHASDRKKCDKSLDGVEGPWQKPSGGASFTSACDGPANLVVIEELQVWVDAGRKRQTLFPLTPIPRSRGDGLNSLLGSSARISVVSEVGRIFVDG